MSLGSSIPTLSTCDLVFSTKTGSHLYGTSLPTSDVDVKGIFFPDSRAILLGTTPPLLSSSTTPKAHGVRNTNEDTDVDYYSLARFIHLLFSGQPDAIEMLFSTDTAWITTSPRGTQLFELLKRERKRWVNAKIASRFRGFAFRQVDSWEKKSGRITALKATKAWLEGLAGSSKDDGEKLLSQLVDKEQVASWVKTQELSDALLAFTSPESEPWVVTLPNVTLSSSHHLSALLSQVDGQLKTYGSRTLSAHENGGVDWKAVAHAVRLAKEGREMVKHGEVVLPRPDEERQLLLKIRTGSIPATEVMALLDIALKELSDEEAVADAEGRWPEKADFEWAERLVLKTHEDIVRKAWELRDEV